MEKEGFTVVAGFIRRGSSGALICFETTDFHIEGKEGNWLAYDSIIVDDKEFFLMEHTTYGANAANVVLDGRLNNLPKKPRISCVWYLLQKEEEDNLPHNECRGSCR